MRAEREPRSRTGIAPGSRIRIGTSGWTYDRWKGPFYPSQLTEREYLPYYAGRFSTVEVADTFYRVPEERTICDWRSTVPDSFVFSVKANRAITHLRRLNATWRATTDLLSRINRFENQLGPVLFQLPAPWHVDLARLNAFLEILPPRRYAFEFRDPSWFDWRVYEVLARHGAAFSIYNLAGQLSPQVVTADFVYVRLRLPDGPQRAVYEAEFLARWASMCRGWEADGFDVFCYVENDASGSAPFDATRLRELIHSDAELPTVSSPGDIVYPM